MAECLTSQSPNALRECPVCLLEYKDPKLLPCTHTVCLKCLEGLNNKGVVKCPQCNVEHKVPARGVKAFTENQMVVELLAINQVSVEL